jgi:hypothetical protein
VNGINHRHRQSLRVRQVATLVRSVPVRLVEISRGGCRLECPNRLETGTNGVLAIELAGILLVDDIRVARCQPRMGAGAVFQVGAELLRTRRLGRRTIRMVVGEIIANEHGTVRDGRGSELAFPGNTRPGEVNGKSDGRAPPAMSDRGS